MKNEYTVTWKLIKEWTRDIGYGGIRLVFKVIYSILGVISLLSAVLITVMCIKNRIDSLTLNIAVLFFISAFAFYRAFLQDILMARQRYNLLSKTYGASEWKRTVEIGEESITLKEGIHTAEYEYRSVSEIKEKGNKIFICLSDRTAIIMYKDSFVDCTWEECKNRITEKKA